ncbi:MAG: DUF4190 domain-containing protein [Anaerolineaceae bacterium]
MTENPSPKPVEQTVVEQQTVQQVDNLTSRAAPTTVVSKTTQVSAPDKGVNMLGVIGFIIAVVALFFYNVYAIPGILAVILSSIALSQIDHDGTGGRGFATWGVVLGLLAIVWVVLQYFGIVNTDGMLLTFLTRAFGFTR